MEVLIKYQRKIFAATVNNIYANKMALYDINSAKYVQWYCITSSFLPKRAMYYKKSEHGAKRTIKQSCEK